MSSKILGYAKKAIFFILAAAFNLHAAICVADEKFVRIPGHTLKQTAMSKAVFVKSVDAGQTVPLTFVLPLRNEKELEELIARIHDPEDKEHFGKYLSKEEFLDRFAPTEEDYNKVIAYARSMGMAVTSVHGNRTLINVSSKVKTLESGLHLSLNRYQLKDGRKFFAPNSDPAVPASLAPVIRGIIGLNDLAEWHNYSQRKVNSHKKLTPEASSNAYPSGPGGGFAPNDLVIAYNLAGISADGTGEVIALFQLASYQNSDINTYANKFGLPTPKLKHILVDGGSKSGINAEVALDIELALALAPNSEIYVYEGPNTDRGVLDTYNKIATDNIARQISSSWGLGEDMSTSSFLKAENAIFMQMAAQGQTIYAAAGDSGAYDDYPNRISLVVDDPASQPYVVGVGGTTLNVSSQTCAYESEKVWNNGFGNGAGGGGVSKIWPIPEWQKNVPNAYSKNYRNVPDVALNADTNTGYAIYYNGQWEIYGGTSCAAPLWAAFTARVNQELKATGQPALGFANPTFYAIGISSPLPKVFNDIVSGTNQYYSAGTNYDNATGWGSFDGVNLFVNLTNSSAPSGPTPDPDPAEPPIPPGPIEELFPELVVDLFHNGNFKKGRNGTYYIEVGNIGEGQSTGAVQVSVQLPSTFKYSSHKSPGWKFNKRNLTFTRVDPIGPGKSYPTISLVVSVDKRSPSSAVPFVTLSGGGSDSVKTSDPTLLTNKR